ncbi:MAG TPA: hypothetical protein VHS31_00305 [Tepidisphaeraceae bacterium]|jgi:hypothetical protein|nr:hypothetical protein [Tepidisphaeraceae bacterium]
MSCVDSIKIVHYPRDGGPYTTDTILQPSWDILERELRSMHNWEKPNLFLDQDREVPGRNCMGICGGSGVYHVQIADDRACWQQAFNPEGLNDEVDVWLSDQGFATKAKFTWPVEDAVKLVRWYYDHGTPHPSYSWSA